MQNSVCGFRQDIAVCMGLKSDDLLVLRWLVDFSHDPHMKKRMIGGDVYYWINYSAVLKDLPILDVTKDRLRRGIFGRLVDKGVLRHKTVRNSGKDGGVFSYYAFGDSYNLLIKQDPCGENAATHTAKMSEQRPFLHSDLSSKQDNNAAPANGFANADTVKGFSKGEQKPRAESATFSAELQNFVDATYPALFEQYNGYQHPRLKPYQRVRTLTILRDYLQDYTESIDALESAAEEFVSDGESDGNILAFANPQTIEIRLNRC